MIDGVFSGDAGIDLEPPGERRIATRDAAVR